MNRGLELWNDMEQNTSENSVQKLVNKCGCFKNCAMYNRKLMQFLKHRSYTGVYTSVWYNSGDTILDALLFT